METLRHIPTIAGRDFSGIQGGQQFGKPVLRKTRVGIAENVNICGRANVFHGARQVMNFLTLIRGFAGNEDVLPEMAQRGASRIVLGFDDELHLKIRIILAEDRLNILFKLRVCSFARTKHHDALTAEPSRPKAANVACRPYAIDESQNALKNRDAGKYR